MCIIMHNYTCLVSLYSSLKHAVDVFINFIYLFLQASKVEFAAVRIWETKSWGQVALLTHHTLTVTQLAFSHDSRKLLVVSRDRCWSLWNRNEAGVEREGKRTHINY